LAAIHLARWTQAKISADFRTEPDGEGGEYGLDSNGRRASHRPANSFYFDGIAEPPLAYAESVADLDRYQWGEVSDERLEILRREAKRLHEETDYAILGSFGAAFLEGGQGLRGWDQFMMDLAGNRSLPKRCSTECWQLRCGMWNVSGCRRRLHPDHSDGRRYGHAEWSPDPAKDVL
jgi:hypothetical protein